MFNDHMQGQWTAMSPKTRGVLMFKTRKEASTCEHKTALSAKKWRDDKKCIETKYCLAHRHGEKGGIQGPEFHCRYTWLKDDVQIIKPIVGKRKTTYIIKKKAAYVIIECHGDETLINRLAHGNTKKQNDVPFESLNSSTLRNIQDRRRHGQKGNQIRVTLNRLNNSADGKVPRGGNRGRINPERNPNTAVIKPDVFYQLNEMMNQEQASGDIYITNLQRVAEGLHTHYCFECRQSAFGQKQRLKQRQTCFTVISVPLAPVTGLPLPDINAIDVLVGIVLKKTLEILEKTNDRDMTPPHRCCHLFKRTASHPHLRA